MVPKLYHVYIFMHICYYFNWYWKMFYVFWKLQLICLFLFLLYYFKNVSWSPFIYRFNLYFLPSVCWIYKLWTVDVWVLTFTVDHGWRSAVFRSFSEYVDVQNACLLVLHDLVTKSYLSMAFTFQCPWQSILHPAPGSTRQRALQTRGCLFFSVCCTGTGTGTIVTAHRLPPTLDFAIFHS